MYIMVTNSCLKNLQSLTSNLQAETKDTVSAVKEIGNVIATLQDIRDNVHTRLFQWFSTVEKLCTYVGTVPFVLRRCGRQIHRSNTPAEVTGCLVCQ